MNASERLDAIEARANALGDEGPWETERIYWKRPTLAEGWFVEVFDEAGTVVLLSERDDTPGSPGAANLAGFIAHARQDVPALVAALRAVLDVLDTAAAEYRTTADRLAAESIDRSIPREDRPAADDVIRYGAYSGAAAGAARRAREVITAHLGGAS